MKKNKIRAAVLTMAAAFFVTFTGSMTAYANVPDDADDGGSVEVIFSDSDEDETEEVSENEAPDDTEDATDDTEGILTPEGNLTLVDDIDEEHSDSLQYVTVQTRNGNYFYLIVDRSGSTDNVYFLNMVDESDLLQILSEEEQELIDQINHKDEKEEEPVIIEDEPQTEEQEEIKDTGGRMKSSLPMLFIFLVIGGIIAGAYYFLKIKPNKDQPEYDEDMEFYDDEDYINEDDGDDSLDDESSTDEPDEDLQFIDFDDAGVDPDIGDYE